MDKKRIQLGKLLLEQKLITQAQLDEAILKQTKSGRKLGQVIVELGFVTEEQILRLLAEQLHIPYVDLNTFPLDKELVNVLPEFYARRLRCLVLEKDDTSYLVGMVDPQDAVAYDELTRILKKTIRLSIVRETDLLRVLDVVYRHTTQISNLAEEVSVDIGKDNFDVAKLTVGTTSADAPVAKLLQTIFEDAVQVNASDVHIEPDEQALRIRQRIDGVLHEQILKEKKVADALALRLKLMASLNIAEKRIPQDGRFSIKVRDKSFDVRLSTMPGQFGESVVMRLLNHSAQLLNLENIGIPKEMLARIRKIMTMPNGLFLITGPTGSGKTTSLYGMLNELNKPDVKIITVEDPVEYRMPRLTQVQIQPKIELDFARVLRATLRQDPDIIMVGEIRDQETVEISIRAAMTGHFVFATLHTNDAVSTPERLLDMGAEGYLLAAVLRAIIAQRLVRRICPNCVKDHTLTPAEQAWVSGISGFNSAGITFKMGAGCTYCYQTGYKGQIGLYEILEITSELADALRQGNVIEFVRRARADKHYVPLVISGLELAKQGITTVSEVIRATGEILD